MNVWAKMVTALRGGVTEAGEAVVDSQALRILDQEVRDSSAELDRSKAALADILAREKLSGDKVTKLEAAVTEHEGYALKALEQSNETLAEEVAQKIADLEAQLAAEREVAAGFGESGGNLREAIRQAEDNIRHLRQQVDTVKAVDNVQRAQAAVAERFGGSNAKLRTAMESLERIKARQDIETATMSVNREIAATTTDVALHKKLQDAGIAPRSQAASDVLARLKAKGK